MILAVPDQKKTLGILSLIAFLLFIPFSGKPFHIDSPVSVYIAKQIIANPVNPPAGDFGPLLWPWNHTELPESSAFRATPHPPLLSYWLALVISIFGDDERVVNWSFFPFYVGAILYFHLMCRLFALRSAFLVTLAYAVAPVVYVNAQNVMYDLPLGMCCTATFYYLFRSNRWKDAAFAAVFAGAGCLIKFTAGTLVVCGCVYLILNRRWRTLFVFVLIAGVFNMAWMLHNFLVLGDAQLTGNGHARYIIGDLRYRFERMVSFLGALMVFSLIPLFVWWKSRRARIIGTVIFGAASTWAVVLVTILDYSWTSAAIYACSAGAGGILVVFLKELIDTSTESLTNVRGPTLCLHVGLQMAGGLFLTLYASRYALTFIFILLIGLALAVQRRLSAVLEQRLYIAALLVSAGISAALSISDYQIVMAEKRCAEAIARQFPEDSAFFKGRLGYLYYMYNAGAHSLTDAKAIPQTGDVVVRNGFYPRDDADYFATHRNELQLFDSLTYPLFPLRTIGGRAGFYGNDRLPYAWVQSPSRRVFYLYRVK